MKNLFFFTVLLLTAANVFPKTYEPTWESLAQAPIPKWWDDGKFGIFIHWGPYSVAGYKHNHRGYAEAITAAMDGLGISSAEIEAYLAQPRVQYQGGQPGLNQIWLQKWVSLFGNGPEAYAEWRRTGVPSLQAGPDAINEGMIPVRLPYPDRERSLNREAVEAAMARQGGATINSRVWWDTH